MVETHAQSLLVGFSSPAKMSSSSSGSKCCSGKSNPGNSSSGVCSCSSAMVGSAVSSVVLNWFAVFVLACCVVILPNANLALLVEPCP